MIQNRLFYQTNASHKSTQHVVCTLVVHFGNSVNCEFIKLIARFSKPLKWGLFICLFVKNTFENIN